MRRWLGLFLLLAACGSPQASASVPAPAASTEIECRIPSDGCEAAVMEAASFLRDEAIGPASRMVVLWGRSPAGVFHGEVHTCFVDGRYLLVDVIGVVDETAVATLRDHPLDNPPCR